MNRGSRTDGMNHLKPDAHNALQSLMNGWLKEHVPEAENAIRDGRRDWITCRAANVACEVVAQSLEGYIEDKEWHLMGTAPKDGTKIQADIPGHGKDNIIVWVGGLSDSDGNEASSWIFISDQEPPESWTDGICWEVNEDGKKSVEPIRWRYT